MDVLLFGGSFDPPHLGHVELLKEAIRHRRPSVVYIVPSFQTPLKGPASAPPRDRLAMIRTALRELPPSFRDRVRVDTLELRRKKKTYTYELVAELRRRHPKDNLFLLVGTDCLRSFKHWRRWQTILKDAKLLAGKRSGFLTGIDATGLKLEWLPGLFPSISSTEVRRRIAVGDTPSDEVPDSVLRYADKRGLYGRDLHHWLRSSLGRVRYEHTLAVAKLAQELAGVYRLDIDAARTAGLLHDAGRSIPVPLLAAYARRHGLRVPHKEETVRRQPLLIHPFASAYIARSKFGVKDPNVLKAITNHTLGATGMGPLEKVLYVADVASEDRGFREAGAVRALAYDDIDAALREAARVKLAYVITSGFWIHPTGVRFWNELLTSV
jgi:nicotinate-nucleotide adenylyltransferase